MHRPNPFGKYPLVLRDKNTILKRPGELLYDYNEDQIYYVDKHSSEMNNIAKLIYDKIIKAKLENTKIESVKESNQVPGDEDIVPDIQNRKFNTWYMISYMKN